MSSGTGEPLAREAEPLAEHLLGVSGRAATIADADPPLDEVVEVAGLLHDFGKFTPYFQAALDDDGPERSSLSDHAALGAFAAHYALKERDHDDEDALVAFVAVARHHGRLPDVVEYVVEHPLDATRQEALRTQVQSIDEAHAEAANSVLETATGGAGSWSEFRDGMLNESIPNGIQSGLTRGLGQLDLDAFSERFYGAAVQTWGALTVADKTTAARVDAERLRHTDLDPAAIDEEIKLLLEQDEGSSDLNALREEARQTVIENAESFVATGAGDVATITLPTGMGKTLTGLQAALRMREMKPGDGRVVYALPFTSVIDQTVTTAKAVFDVSEFGDSLTVHHHLAETVTTDAHDPDADPDEFAERDYLLGKTWRAGLVVTTYVQLWESLVGPSNQQSLKLSSLYNSVVLLDEPQSIPLDWWRLVRRVTRTLVEDYNATVISMTATQPRLFTSENSDLAVEALVDDRRQYFEGIERVEYALDDSLAGRLDGGDPPRKTHRAAAQDVFANLSDEEPSALAVCNTVDSAVAFSSEVSAAARRAGHAELALGDIYAPLAEQGDSDVDTLVDRVYERAEATDRPLVTLHLTTRHRPKDRRVLLDAASRLADDSVLRFVFVSTQLVEAGVDVSFTRAYRDFAPLPSIIQVAGRCNRSDERDRGVVTVWVLDEPSSDASLPSDAVYKWFGPDKLEPTRRALATIVDSDGRASEATVTTDGIDEYYQILDEQKDVGVAQWVEWVDDALFAKLADLSLIEERDDVDVIVPRSPEEADLADDLLGAMDAGDYPAAYDALEALDDCRISVPENAVAGGEAIPDLDVVRLDADDAAFSPLYGVY